MKKMASTVFAVLLSCLSVSALAARPNVTYAELGYQAQNVDDGCDPSGLSVTLSYATSSQTLIEGNFADVEDSNGCGYHNISLGYGLRADVGGSSIMYGIGRLIHRDYGIEDDVGLGAEFGLRSIFSPGLELKGYAGFEKVDEFDQSYVGIGVDYWVAKGFSVAGTFSLNDESDTTLGVAMRFHF